MLALSFSHVSFSYPSQPVLEDVSFTCAPGQRLCVVGPNGAGKSTLLALATGALAPESGEVRGPATTPANSNDHGTIAQAIDAASAHITALLHRFEELSANLSEENYEEYDALLARLTALDAWNLPARTARVLAGLGLGGVDKQRAVNSLSPGQRARLRLGLLLVQRPEALVLDEPTNHLDAEAIAFLKQEVRDWAGPVLFASHDRDFIEATATGVLDLDITAWEALATASGGEIAGGAHLTSGRYSDYLHAKEQARARHRELHAQQQERKREIQRHQRDSEVVGHADFTPRTETRMAQKFYADRAQATSTRRITNDARKLDALRQREVRKPRYESTQIVLADAGVQRGDIALSLREASVPGRLAPVSAELSAGEHLLITGPNGAGKSTLLRWVAGGDSAAGGSGEVRLNVPGAAVGFVPQELPGPDHPHWSEPLGERAKGFLHPKFWNTPLSALSAGNQRRAQLALAVGVGGAVGTVGSGSGEQVPELLIIDEPTNYLDLDTIESLERALMEWSGTLIITSHDEWLISKWLEPCAEGEAVRRHVVLGDSVAGSAT